MRTLLVALVTVLAASVAAAQAPLRFPGPRVETNCSGTWRVAVGDVNLDGHPDLITTRNADTGGTGFMLVVGRGDGTFEEPVGVPGETDAQLALGDVDGDGDADLLSFDVGASGAIDKKPAVLVRLSEAGVFGDAVTSMKSGTVGYPSGILAADFDGDGRADVLARVNIPGALLHVGLSQGDGTFLEQDGIGASGGALATADFNGDGQLDIVGGEQLTVWINSGSGTFANGIENATTGFYYYVHLAPADFDLDGHVDALASYGGADISVWRGAGDGHLGKVQDLDEPIAISDFGAADLDEDGRPDVLASGLETGPYLFAPAGLWTLRGLGDLSFEDAVYHRTGGSPQVLALADLDTDGHVDAITGQIFFSDPSVPLGDLGVSFGLGDGGLVGADVVALPGGPTRVALADLDGDGRLDLACAREAGPGPAVALGAGDGSFGAATDVPLGVTGGELLAADLDDDGLADLAASDAQTLVVALGLGGGLAFGPAQPLGAGDLSALRVADLDGDGTLDLVAARKQLHVVDVWLGLGGGAFGPPQAWPAGGAPVDLAVADLDGDGDADLAAADPGQLVLARLFNTGAAAFAAPAPLPFNIMAEHVAAADLDGDEAVDLATSNPMGTVRTWPNTGAGDFVEGAEVDVGPPARALRAADVNRDGLPDLIAVHTTPGAGSAQRLEQGAPGQVTLLLASPGGTLAPPLGFFAGGTPLDVAVGDVDGNGFADFVAPARSDDEVWVLLNPSGPWTSLGYALAASFGTPTLVGSGVPAANEKVTLLADGVPAHASGLLYLATDTALQPLQGGVLVPEPLVVVPVRPGVPLFGRWPAGFPVGAPIYAQAWFATSGGAGMEVSATNALITLGQ